MINIEAFYTHAYTRNSVVALCNRTLKLALQIDDEEGRGSNEGTSQGEYRARERMGHTIRVGMYG
jgi:hypothetical protein